MAAKDFEVFDQLNRDFYRAFEDGDLDVMVGMWSQRDDALCVHPGALPIRGAEAIKRGWVALMSQVEYIQFFLTDVEVSQVNNVATVTCIENVLTGDADPQMFRGNQAVATNVYLKEPGGWKLWIHHASPVAWQEASTTEGE